MKSNIQKTQYSLKAFVAFFYLVASSTAVADTKCAPQYVQTVMHNEQGVYIQLEGEGWRMLAEMDDNHKDTKMATAMQAKTANLKVELSYANQDVNSECTEFSQYAMVKKIKIKKNQQE